MSLYDGARIEKPRHLRLAPLQSGRSDRPVHVVGFDTEAIGGQPVMLQLSEGGGWADADLITLPDEPNAALTAFVYWVDEHCRARRTEHLVFGFNLQYEWTQLFGDLSPTLTSANEFRLYVSLDNGRSWRLDVLNYRRHAMRMTNDESKVSVRVLDASAFFPGSLAAVAKMVGVEDKEALDKQFLAGLTRADLTDPRFRRYAGQDAVTTRLVGERVVEMHEAWDVATCYTAPHLASRVFRRAFLQDEVLLPDAALEQAGLFSYHGGKNGYYRRRPVSLPAWSLDIVSAYPKAMRILPAIEGNRWVRTSTYREGAHGLWLVRLDHRRCRYGGAFSHVGHRLASGQAEVWLTSYELDVMLAYDEARAMNVLDGYVMEGDGPDGGGLAAFVDRFFEEKRTTAGVQRVTAKLMLNSLYGKFFQKTPVGSVGSLVGDMGEDGGLTIEEQETDPSQPFDFRAGGLYHPPIASLITGYVRAWVHDLEHRHEAIATSTDGLFSTRAPDPTLVGDGLGMLTADYGHLRIWRERLYAFGEHPDGPVSKFALHGFRSTRDELQMIPLEPGRYRYTASHAMSLRESQRLMRGRRYRPGEFAVLDFELDLTERS